MSQFAISTIISLLLLLPSTQAIPQFWHAKAPGSWLQGRGEKPHGFPTLSISSSDGVFPTGPAGSGTGTGTGTGTAVFPTATGSASIAKRDARDPFGLPLPHEPSFVLPTGFPTVLPTIIPTGTAPLGSGTGTILPIPTHIPGQADVDAAKETNRQHFEGPRKRSVHPYWPYELSAADGLHARSPTAPTGATGSGVIPPPLPTGATGTSAIPPPLPTGATGTGVVPHPLPSWTDLPGLFFD